jgi:hypothetical protein
MRFAIEPVSRKLPANVALSAITCHTNAGSGSRGRVDTTINAYW